MHDTNHNISSGTILDVRYVQMNGMYVCVCMRMKEKIVH